MVAGIVIPDIRKRKSTDRGPGLPWHKMRPYLKMTKAKRAGVMHHVVQHLPSRRETRSSAISMV
jgi:hypothetical protein